MAVAVTDLERQPAVRVVKRSLSLGALVWIMLFTVSGGAYGLEDVVGESGAGMALVLIRSPRSCGVCRPPSWWGAGPGGLSSLARGEAALSGPTVSLDPPRPPV